MADILIRGVPDDVLAAIDAKARRLGLSRTEFLRRLLARERTQDAGRMTVDHFEQLAERAADLGDPEVMSGAWS